MFLHYHMELEIFLFPNEDNAQEFLKICWIYVDGLFNQQEKKIKDKIGIKTSLYEGYMCLKLFFLSCCMTSSHYLAVLTVDKVLTIKQKILLHMRL